MYAMLLKKFNNKHTVHLIMVSISNKLTLALLATLSNKLSNAAVTTSKLVTLRFAGSLLTIFSSE